MATKLTDEEISEYIADMKKANPAGLSPQEWSEYEADVRTQHGQTTTDKALAVGGKAVDVGLRGLDYLGGLARTSVFDALSASDRVTWDDYRKAFKGQAPGSGEYLERKGVTEGKKLSDVLPSLYSDTGEEWHQFQKGGAADPSARGTLGFAADVALDPLNYLSLGGTAAARAGARAATKSAGREVAERTTKDKAQDLLSMVARPGDNLLQSTGRKVYKSAFKDVDAHAISRGKPPVSDLLFSKGIGGTNRNISNRVVDEMQLLDTTRAGLVTKGDAAIQDKWGRVSMKKAMKHAFELSDRLKSDPATRAAGEQLEARAMEYVAKGPQSLATATKWKTTAREGIPDGGWGSVVRTPSGRKGAKAIGGGLQKGVEETAEAAVPGLGGQIKSVNDEWGQLLTSTKGLNKKALSAEKRKYLSDADIVSGLIAMGGAGPLGGGGVLAGKKALDLSRSTWARTRSGQILDAFGGGASFTNPAQPDLLDKLRFLTTPVSRMKDPVLRQILLSEFPEEPNRTPWEKAKEK